MIGLDESAAAALIDDLIGKQQRHGNMLIELPPIAAVQLAGLVNLSLRHPELPPSHRTIGRAIVTMIRGYFADCPAVAALLDADAAASAGEVENGTKTRH